MVNKYGWVDTGSSFLPSEINSAFLLAQLEHLDEIQRRRMKLWEKYNIELESLADHGFIIRPYIPNYATNNAHMYYFICRDLNERTKLLSYLNDNGILAVFHYLSLHHSDYYMKQFSERPSLENCDHFSDCLIRLPMFYELKEEQVDYITSKINSFYE